MKNENKNLIYIGDNLKIMQEKHLDKFKEKFIDLYKKNQLVFKNNRPYEKNYIDDATDNITSILRFFSRNGTEDLKKWEYKNYLILQNQLS